MPTATIEVKYVNEPSEGKKTGSIKGANGELYGVFPEMLPNFTTGKVYEVEYGEREFKGKMYRTIKRIMPRQFGAPAPVDSWKEEIVDELPHAGGGDNVIRIDQIPASTHSLKPLAMAAGLHGRSDMADLFAIELVSGLAQGLVATGISPNMALDKATLTNWLKTAKEIWNEAV